VIHFGPIYARRLRTMRRPAPGKCTNAPALLTPPLWAPPAPMPPINRQHNGGPPLEPRRRGRPRISTPELRERLLALLFEGLPLRAICRTPGMPGREAVYAWRRADPKLDRSCRFIADAGRKAPYYL
jgi:hypothetical protein